MIMCTDAQNRIYVKRMRQTDRLTDKSTDGQDIWTDRHGISCHRAPASEGDIEGRWSGTDRQDTTIQTDRQTEDTDRQTEETDRHEYLVPQGACIGRRQRRKRSGNGFQLVQSGRLKL